MVELGWVCAALDVHVSANSLALRRLVQEEGDNLTYMLALSNWNVRQVFPLSRQLVCEGRRKVQRWGEGGKWRVKTYQENH